MICRVWHGYTTPERAEAYERLLREEILSGIEGRAIAGLQGIDLLRRAGEDEVEFVTMMWFDSLDAVREFAGEDYEAAVVPAAAQEVLARWDRRSAHFEVRDRRAAGGIGGGD